MRNEMESASDGKKIDPIILGVIFISLVIIGGIVIASSYSNASDTPVYNKSSSEKPRLEMSQKEFTFGNMSVSETKTQDITLKNIGNKPLNLSNFSTSCDCTYVQLLVGESISPKFTMSKSTWSKELVPDQSATLKITYKPSIMPVEGEVTRTVYFKTNDPENPNVDIKFKAIVSK